MIEFVKINKGWKQSIESFRDSFYRLGSIKSTASRFSNLR